MQANHRLLPLLTLCALPAYAVYAPIPEPEQGKALTFRLGTSVSHDSNIFGTASGVKDSFVYNVSPGVAFNSSITDQTFLSLGYDLSLDHVADRPGSKDLPSHLLKARVAHQFSSATTLDLSDTFSIEKNPESLLNGLPLNTDQSFQRNEFDGRFTTTAGEKTGLVFKYRNLVQSYDSRALGDQLNHTDQLAGLELNQALLPETKLAGEYRFQDIAYATGGADKNKRSNFGLVGVDYSPGKKLQTSARVGVEARTRESQRSATAPYAELTGRYAYNPDSYLSAGYAYTYEEPSDVTRYTDSKVNRFFVNVQHQLAALVTASASADYEPAQLQGRIGQANLSETTTRFGLGLSWQPTRNWTLSATCDFDRVSSDDPSRNQNRTRFGLAALAVF